MIGKGVKGRTLTAFDTHLSRSDDSSPFSITCDKFTGAVEKEIRAGNKVLSKKVEDILKQIYDQFEEIADDKSDDPSEQQLRRGFVGLMAAHELTFEQMKLDLARIKRRYET